MDTQRLASLVAAAELGSVSAAARHLGARLSTTSRHITDLEAAVGAALLVRTGRGVRPTHAGERFVERARFVLRELESAAAEARGDREQGAAHLRVSAPLEMALSLLPACIAEFRARCPEVTLDLHSAARRVSLLEEDFDAAIRLGRLSNVELIARRLGEVPLVLCAAPTPKARRLTFKDLGASSWVSVAEAPERTPAALRGKPAGKNASKHASRKVMLEPSPRIRVSTFSEAAEIAAASDLLTLLPAYTAERFLRSGRLVTVVPELALPSVDVHMLLDARHRETLPLKALAEIVTARLRDVGGSGSGRRR